MGRKQKERQKKKNNKKLLAAATATAMATATTTATATASSGDVDGDEKNSATADHNSSVDVDVDVDIDIDIGDGVGVGVGVSVGVDDGVAAPEKVRTTETTTMATCYHGSTAENVAKGSQFHMVIDEWLTILMNLAGKNSKEAMTVISNFRVKHKKLMNNTDFGKQVFASATNIFLVSYGSEEYSSSSKRMLQNVLSLGIELKYIHSPLFADTEKYDKYSRDIETDRGIINCLFRETNTFCNCMKPYKEEAKNMEKVGMCYGCKDQFPKRFLMRCSRCLFAQYCTKECMKIHWPKHKNYCAPHNESEE